MSAPAWLHLPAELSLARCGPAAVGIFTTSNRFHVGVLQRTDGQPVRVVHLAFHHLLKEEAASDRWGWVETDIVDDKLRLVAAFARRVHRSHQDGKVPYALRLAATRLNHQGRLLLGTSERGLTCATFVILVFREMGVDLIDPYTWEQRSVERVAEDTAAQIALVDLLRKMDPTHAAAVEAEVGCLRFRPEEVAAASANPPRPVEFGRAEGFGRRVVSAFGR